jgi:CheY-like chemotaxis protein
MRLADATILVVDDEPELLEIFAVWLGRNGCTVKTAANGADALRLLLAEKIDALITDIRMPVMDGMTLVRTLYEKKVLIPSIIFVSGFGDVNEREAYSLGVEAMLAKPLSRQTLLKALEDSLKDRDELWLTPMETTPQKLVQLAAQELSREIKRCGFQLGRGGCCFRWTEALAEDTHVRLEIDFSGDELSLRGEATVRWFNAKDSRVGVEFEYLAPECREWVVERMNAEPMFSFIPRC